MSLFNHPTRKTLGDRDVYVLLLCWGQFDDALAVGKWMQGFNAMMPTLDDLSALDLDGDVRAAIERLVAGCISVADVMDSPEHEAATRRQLSVGDVRSMPIMTLLEAVLLIMEVNLDFFLQSLQTCMAIKTRLLSTGSLSPSS